MALELDASTRAQLNGQFSFEDYHGKGIHIFERPGRSLRTVPPFSQSDAQLKAVIVKVATSYIFRNKTVPKDFVPNFTTLHDLAGGDWLGMVSAIAYRSWRLRWHNNDVAVSLAMKERSVMSVVLKLRQAAELLGYDVGTHGYFGGKKNGSDEKILALWSAGKTIGEIRQEIGASRARIRLLLKKRGVWRKRVGTRRKVVTRAVSPEVLCATAI